jgi:hypothetical protein
MEDRWAKLEEIVRRVVREELASLGKKPKIDFVAGKFIGITEEQREAWLAAYGAVDLDAELKRAAAWCVSNPHLAPKSQISRFLNTWLTKAQNQASLRSIPLERPRPTAIPPSLCEYCLRTSTGSVNGRRHCDEHAREAMDGVRPGKMPGIEAKRVAGVD